VLNVLIVLLTLATAAVHFSFFARNPSGSELIYALNALGYVTLLILLFAPVRRLDQWHQAVRRILMAYAATTIVAYIVFGLTTGDWTAPLGPITKLIEVILIGLLWWQDQQQTIGVAHV
jgi:hypothetical protein